MTARPWRALALLPPGAILIGVPLLNGARATVFGFPLLLAWIVGAVLLTSIVMAVIGALDRRADAAPRAADPGPPPR